MHTLDQLLKLSQTPEGKQKLRELLAEALGWRWSPTALWGFPEGKCEAQECPNWPEDLNACSVIEESLKYKQLEAMHSSLAEVQSSWMPKRRHTAYDFMWHASAVQRIIALILTLQKP